MVLILFGTGVVAHVVLFVTACPAKLFNGGLHQYHPGLGIGGTMGFTFAGKTSGAHLNPAVTITLAAFAIPVEQSDSLFYRSDRGRVHRAALVFWNYHRPFCAPTTQLDHTAGVFTTFPAFPDLVSRDARSTIGTRCC